MSLGYSCFGQAGHELGNNEEKELLPGTAHQQNESLNPQKFLGNNSGIISNFYGAGCGKSVGGAGVGLGCSRFGRAGLGDEEEELSQAKQLQFHWNFIQTTFTASSRMGTEGMTELPPQFLPGISPKPLLLNPQGCEQKGCFISHPSPLC